MALKDSFALKRIKDGKQAQVDTSAPMEIRYLTKEEKADLRSLFQKHDKYGEGKILVQNAIEEMKDRGMKPKDPEIKEWLEQKTPSNKNKKGAPKAQDNFITMNELELIIRAHVSKIEYEEAQLYAQFQKFDLDGNGKITKDELIHILKNCGKSEEEAEEEAHALISEADDNGDEEIEFEEFKQMFGLE